MAKQLRWFLGLLIAACAICAYLNIWQFFTSDSKSGHLSLNAETGNVENGLDLTVKQTRERTWRLIVARRTKINGNGHNRSSTPLPDVPFRHALDAVSQWNSGPMRRITLADLPSITVSAVDCTALFRRNKKELRKAKRFQRDHEKEVIKSTKFIEQTSNCTQFAVERQYMMWPVNHEEAEFPIAYSVLMYKDVEQFERLLRAIYRPQNLYCIHVDQKSPADIHKAVISIAQCFENIFVLQPSVDVYWGTFSVLEPELECMKRLLQRSKKWRYFINLTGQEFPLKTNWQIVRILKAFNGSNNMEGTLSRFVQILK